MSDCRLGETVQYTGAHHYWCFLCLIGTTLKNPYWPTSQLFIYRNYPPTLFFPYIRTHCLKQNIQCRLVISICIINSLPPKFKLIWSRSPHTCPIHLFYTDSAHASFRPLCPNMCFSVKKCKMYWFTLYSSFCFPHKALYGEIWHYLWLSIFLLSVRLFIAQRG